jgi:hypothetical protein
MVLVGVGHGVGILAGTATASLVAVGTPEAPPDRPAQRLGDPLLVTMGSMMLAIGLIFPTGRGQTPLGTDSSACRDRVHGELLLIVLQPGPLSTFPGIENPFGIGPDLRLGLDGGSPLGA